ncbi:hypothetical protein BZG02_06040 [Labilibaculum filiforme]|uniref:Uncharacterized protein n=1 Tax=Labilibaculum filiforme TaxID=1940526 RepID=A0A2N3I228_9BACT|nr:hypothetical protein [Labilibaculum filiforme]PKQ64375.1 hypothetical protein BZG02_06040 [Labilibaculum filiforme]
MKNLLTRNIVNLLLGLFVISTIVSCEKDDLQDKDSIEIPARTADAESGNLKASISPASGSTLTSSSVTFSWNHPGGYYWIDLGTTAGGDDIFTNSNYFQTKKYTVDNLPSNGVVYLRLWYYYNYRWAYNDYTYTMNVGGASNEITPANGSTLSESSVLFSWTHAADSYRLYVGTTAGQEDIYSSGNISAKSHTIKNIPQSGTVYVRLWLNINNSWSEKYDYTYTAQTGSSTGTKDFILTAVNDGLDQSDMDDFASGLTRLNYTQVLKNVNVSTSQLKDYMGRSIKTLYHTGHGNSGYIATSDNGLSVSSLTSVSVENLIVATCLTMKDKAWKNKFSGRTENIMGYTNYSYDNIDNEVAKDFTAKLGNGKTYLQAWYESNNTQSNLSDRWCCYSRSGSNIIEYSAVSGNSPKTGSSFYSLANGKVLVSNAISKITKSSSLPVNYTYSASTDQMVSEVSKEFGELEGCSISQQNAVEKAQNWVSSQSGFSQVEFDEVVRLSADEAVIGYQVRFKRVVNSLSVRGNELTDYISLLVTDNNIATTQYHWSTITKSSVKSAVNVLSANEAINVAADAMASSYKGDVLKITQVEECLGYKLNSGTSSLVPAYEFISEDGLSIVIDAATGHIL